MLTSYYNLTSLSTLSPFNTRNRSLSHQKLSEIFIWWVERSQDKKGRDLYIGQNLKSLRQVRSPVSIWQGTPEQPDSEHITRFSGHIVPVSTPVLGPTLKGD